MRNVLFTIAILLTITACHRPTALFQRTPRIAAARLPVVQPSETPADSTITATQPLPEPGGASQPETPIASQTYQPTQEVRSRLQQRMHHIGSLLATSTQQPTTQQPDPPKKKLKLGNRIRQSLGMPLRKELNWWQRISWKLKASVIVILVAVVFAILHVTILAIIFGILGAFLMISGLKRSFKVRRPWF